MACGNFIGVGGGGGGPNRGDASFPGLNPLWSKTLCVLIWFTLGGVKLLYFKIYGDSEEKRLGTPDLH
jgi:hypothetical protein